MKEFMTSLRLTGISLLVCCVIYPAILLGLAQALVPWRANGSLLVDASGTAVGSAQIAQRFSRPEYFWPRPSAVDYNAAAAGGSNLSPANPALSERARQELARYDLREGQRLPAELVSASGSGLDPHISPAAARLQAPRVAAARNMPLEAVLALIEDNGEVPMLRVLGGEPVINVLRLNLALDRHTAATGQ